ncbi:methyltransferase family protein [Psychrobacter sp. FME5]|uniref:methyltransferase family protein n=1 Tax=Psychrobacter sp. FME5 TaxID=2487706 RepID=UPI001788383A|nr:isoprenylcysteine carboxylmethyltransferase family protein [Psychrobacter sp. FME5]MBE0445518.1 isoprenylcysteine carboxylmethyltransferase family protein [Psychrobacter sp. FME5]MDN5801943.1 isoprenylcysteine carboxylmethyltransferase family protein [Psychrobacter sp.]MDN5891531.1 isoprenylcysteine carboxylmethyltransferase family protein [Psychrobacter sp.]MDN5897824.1 isoprenylcysteine carboxylmethyltransferase family protein [Psychrobacter sp.]
MNSLELKIPPPAQFAITAAAMFGVSKIVPALKFTLTGSTGLAVGLGVIGLSSGIMGVTQFRKAQTTPNPKEIDKATSLVTSGIYQYSRNPMYLGLTLVLLGWALYLSHFLAFILIPILMMYIARFQIQPEERMMTQKFGQAYQNYCAKVRRWL